MEASQGWSGVSFDGVWGVVTVDGEASNGVTFTVRENRAPETEGKIAAQTVNKGESSELTVSSYFSDPDEDTLEYWEVSSDTTKGSVTVTGAVVTLTGAAKGSATVTVTASDGHGGEVDQEFDVTVTVPTMPTPSISSISPPQQPPDTQVTISGSNFGSIQGSVSFGSDSASIHSWSNTSISCFTPLYASAGTVSVTVTTSANKTSSGYNYTITGQSPVRGECGDGEDCPGDDKPKKGGSGGGDSEESEDPPGDGG